MPHVEPIPPGAGRGDDPRLLAETALETAIDIIARGGWHRAAPLVAVLESSEGMTSEPFDNEERRELEEALRLVLENLATLTAERNRIAVLVANITEGLDEIAAQSDPIAAILDSLDRRGGTRRDGPCPP